MLAKIKSFEKETSLKSYRGERDKAQDDLRSKLKAAESLCESLMDENEDMKKEIRQLEEEIYELQDNFRYFEGFGMHGKILVNACYLVFGDLYLYMYCLLYNK